MPLFSLVDSLASSANTQTTPRPRLVLLAPQVVMHSTSLECRVAFCARWAPLRTFRGCKAAANRVLPAILRPYKGSLAARNARSENTQPKSSLQRAATTARFVCLMAVLSRVSQVGTASNTPALFGSCPVCSQGSISAHNGSTLCSICPHGKFALEPYGATVCHDCLVMCVFSLLFTLCRRPVPQAINQTCKVAVLCARQEVTLTPLA